MAGRIIAVHCDRFWDIRSCFLSSLSSGHCKSRRVKVML
ncbi:unnamed protein product [Brassica rapa subsp. trilocularis]